MLVEEARPELAGAALFPTTGSLPRYEGSIGRDIVGCMRSVVAVVLIATLCAATLLADQGMWTFGNVPRTNAAWRGPGQRTTDIAISKTQRIGTASITLRADVLNLFDDPLFNGPVTTFGTSTFGQVTAVGGFARSMQFQARLGF